MSTLKFLVSNIWKYKFIILSINLVLIGLMNYKAHRIEKNLEQNTPVTKIIPELVPKQPVVLTIVTACHSINRTIFNQTIASVMNQTLNNFEWILVNDNPTDKSNTLEIDSVSRLYPDKIKVITMPKQTGLPGARNKGINMARGKFTMFLDDDDILEPTYCEKTCLFLALHPEMTMCNTHSLGFGGKEYIWRTGFEAGKKILFENRLTVTTVIRTGILRHLGGFDRRLINGGEDWNLWLRIIGIGHWGYTIPEILFRYRTRKEQKWKNLQNTDELLSLMKKTAPYAYKDYHIINRYDGGLNKQLVDPYIGNVMSIPFSNPVHSNWDNNVIMITDKNHQYSSVNLTTIITDDCNGMDYSDDIHCIEHYSEPRTHGRVISYLIDSRKPRYVVINNSQLGYLLLPYLYQQYPQVKFVDFKSDQTELHTKYLDDTITSLSQLDRTSKKYHSTDNGLTKQLLSYYLSRQRPTLSCEYGIKLQTHCGEEHNEQWTNNLLSPVSCTGDKLDIGSLTASALYQCNQWCIWDLTTSADLKQGWELTGSCFIPFDSNSTSNPCIQNYFHQRPQEVVEKLSFPNNVVC